MCCVSHIHRRANGGVHFDTLTAVRELVIIFSLVPKLSSCLLQHVAVSVSHTSDVELSVLSWRQAKDGDQFSNKVSEPMVLSRDHCSLCCHVVCAVYKENTKHNRTSLNPLPLLI